MLNQLLNGAANVVWSNFRRDYVLFLQSVWADYRLASASGIISFYVRGSLTKSACTQHDLFEFVLLFHGYFDASIIMCHLLSLENGYGYTLIYSRGKFAGFTNWSKFCQLAIILSAFGQNWDLRMKFAHFCPEKEPRFSKICRKISDYSV